MSFACKKFRSSKTWQHRQLGSVPGGVVRFCCSPPHGPHCPPSRENCHNSEFLLLFFSTTATKRKTPRKPPESCGFRGVESWPIGEITQANYVEATQIASVARCGNSEIERVRRTSVLQMKSPGLCTAVQHAIDKGDSVSLRQCGEIGQPPRSQQSARPRMPSPHLRGFPREQGYRGPFVDPEEQLHQKGYSAFQKPLE